MSCPLPPPCSRPGRLLALALTPPALSLAALACLAASSASCDLVSVTYSHGADGDGGEGGWDAGALPSGLGVFCAAGPGGGSLDSPFASSGGYDSMSSLARSFAVASLALASSLAVLASCASASGGPRAARRRDGGSGRPCRT